MVIFITVCTGFLIITALISLYRIYKGPKVADRIVALNVITTKVVTIIVFIALITSQESYVSVALVYALIGFLTTIGTAKYLLKGKLK